MLAQLALVALSAATVRPASPPLGGMGPVNVGPAIWTTSPLPPPAARTYVSPVPPPAPPVLPEPVATTPEGMLASAAAALCSGDPGKAEKEALRFHERFPRDPRSRLLLGAFLEERDPDRAAALYKQAGGVPTLPGVEPQQAVTAAGTAWVAATAAKVRLEPREEASAVGVLPIGSRVEVIELSGKFALARCPPPLRLAGRVPGAKLVPGARTPPSADAGPLEAFVALEFLDGKPPAEARYAERAGEATEPAQKLSLLLRAHALAPDDVAVLLSLRDVAAQAQQWWYAIAAERLWLQLSAEKPPVTVEVRRFFGCRGDWRKAVTVRPRAPLSDALALAPGQFEDDSGAALAAFPRDGCLADFTPASLDCEERVSRLFPSPPLVKVTIRNRTLAARAVPRFFVHATTLAAAGGCNAAAAPVVAPVPITAIRAGGSAEAVFEVPRHAGTLYGVIEAADLSEATAMARARVEEIARDMTPGAGRAQGRPIDLAPLEGWTYGDLRCCCRE